jgi:hypothetical protein
LGGTYRRSHTECGWWRWGYEYMIKILEKDELLKKKLQKVSISLYENITIQDKS